MTQQSSEWVTDAPEAEWPLESERVPLPDSAPPDPYDERDRWRFCALWEE